MKRLLALASLCLAFSLVPISTRADVVTEWNTLALDAIRNESTSPPLAARNLAILHAAIYDAVNALDRAHEPYFMSLPAPPGASMEAAAVGAAYECLSDLYPSQTAAFDAALHQFLARTPATTNRADGLLLGQFVALEMPPHRKVTISGPMIGMAENKLVMTVAPQKLIWPHGST